METSSIDLELGLGLGLGSVVLGLLGVLDDFDLDFDLDGGGCSVYRHDSDKPDKVSTLFNILKN